MPNNISGKKEEVKGLGSLLGEALRTLPLLAFSYVVDEWRWYVSYEADTNGDGDTLNDNWWKLVRRYQGLSPPEPRRGASHFDPASKHHLLLNSPYWPSVSIFNRHFVYH